MASLFVELRRVLCGIRLYRAQELVGDWAAFPRVMEGVVKPLSFLSKFRKECSLRAGKIQEMKIFEQKKRKRWLMCI